MWKFIKKLINISNNLPQYTINEIAIHNAKESCWIIVKNKVYDVTTFLDEHPGGECLFKNAGNDCTYHLSFHSNAALIKMNKYLIGIVVNV
jgi:cytochrome b involved in lipid metabolism